MHKKYFITITAENRSGVLAAITTALAELSGDMHYANQTVVHELFNLTVAARFPEQRTCEVVRDHLLSVGRPYNMQVMIREFEAEETYPSMYGERYFLTLTGKDAPGVVRTVSGMLAEELIDIQSLYAAPSSSDSFSMVMELIIPLTVDVPYLTDEFRVFGSLNGLAIKIEHESEYDFSGDVRNSLAQMLPGDLA